MAKAILPCGEDRLTEKIARDLVKRNFPWIFEERGKKGYGEILALEFH